MKPSTFTNETSRRQFLFKSISTCALSCLGGAQLLANKNFSANGDDTKRFQQDSKMTLEQVYNFCYKRWYIPAMQNLMNQIGKEQFLEMLKKSSDMFYESSQKTDINYQERTLTVFANNTIKACENWKDRLTFEILNNSEELFEIRFTECLWAKTFREAKASDIGYA